MRRFRKTLMLLFTIVGTTLFSACSGEKTESVKRIDDTAKNDSITEQQVADTLTTLVQTLDSINNSGALVHYDVYNIGKFKGIEVSVKKVSVGTTHISHINLRKDCGGEYYYSWEDAMIFAKELPAFYSAISTIQNNIGRSVDHEERYIYLTKDNIALLTSCESGSNWTTRFSVDFNKSNSTVTLSPSEIDTLLDLIKQAESKLKEIE